MNKLIEKFKDAKVLKQATREDLQQSEHVKDILRIGRLQKELSQKKGPPICSLKNNAL